MLFCSGESTEGLSNSDYGNLLLSECLYFLVAAAWEFRAPWEGKKSEGRQEKPSVPCLN